jgi:hypothetical protein
MHEHIIYSCFHFLLECGTCADVLDTLPNKVIRVTHLYFMYLPCSLHIKHTQVYFCVKFLLFFRYNFSA